MGGPAYYTGTMNIAKNDDWVVAFIYSSPQEVGPNAPINLTGSTLKMEIRKNETDNEAIVAVTSAGGDGIYITDAIGGAFTIAITRHERLFRLGPGEYVADLVRLMPSGYQERIWEGKAIVVEGTTR